MSPPRFGTPRNPDRRSLGPQVGKVAQRLGMDLMPWQQLVLDVALEVEDDPWSPSGYGLVYPEVVVSTPRQQGKSTLVLSKVIHRAKALAVFGGPQRVLYTAQDRNNARKKWLEDHVGQLERSGAFRGQYKVSKANGAELIRWANGSLHGICAPTDEAAHGETLDEGVIDEAWAHETDDVEQGMSPAMITRRNRQFCVLSTAGTAKSRYLWRKVNIGRELTSAAGSQRAPFAYFEWSAPEDAPIDDPATWAACNPAYGITITRSALEFEFRRLAAKGPEGLDQFRRAHLNQWVEIPVLQEAPVFVVDLEAWLRAADTDPDDPLTVPESARMLDPVALAIDASPGLTSAAIGAAGHRGDGLPQVECVEHRQGTDWLAPRLLELVRRHKPAAVLLDESGPVGSLVPDLERVGITLQKVSAREHAQATGLFLDRANRGTLRHIAQPELLAAIQAARLRPMGEASAFTRRNAGGDVCPLIACTLALWALTTAPPPKRKAVFGPSKPPTPSADVFRPTSRLPI